MGKAFDEYLESLLSKKNLAYWKGQHITAQDALVRAWADFRRGKCELEQVNEYTEAEKKALKRIRDIESNVFLIGEIE